MHQAHPQPVTLWQATKAVVKQLLNTDVHALKSVPFSAYGGAGWGSGGDAPGRFSTLYAAQPGAAYDYRTAAGNPLDNGVVAACVDAIAQAVADAPPVLQQRDGDAWQPVPTHPLLDLLRLPNGFYGSSHLWAATVAGECVTGNGFWRLVWDDTHSQPVEIWWEPSLTPRFDAGNFITDYLLRVDGKAYSLQRGEVVHFRHALHPRNPRLGWTPLDTAMRQIAGDNSAATYHGALLRNSAVASLMVSLKEANTSITPDQISQLMQNLERKVTGEGAGRIAGSNLPVEISKLGYSPEELALDKLVNYYEARICAALRVPPMVLGLVGGNEHRTYSNYGEAIRDFWQRTIKPIQNRHAAELGAQLLPLFQLDPAEYRIVWDYSQVAALQEDEQELYTRLENACSGPFLTPDEARARLHLAPVSGGNVMR
ncbi:MAG: phage portal protein [Abitibacteriaceae bacterium]|nr:phage portal protein [Abditibacteriaceae bacterium]